MIEANLWLRSLLPVFKLHCGGHEAHPTVLTEAVGDEDHADQDQEGRRVGWALRPPLQSIRCSKNDRSKPVATIVADGIQASLRWA
jgi:hypothetical protein